MRRLRRDVRPDQPLDLTPRRTPLEPADDGSVVDEDERRHRAHAERLHQPAILSMSISSTRRRAFSVTPTHATRLDMRRAGPERLLEKKTSVGRSSPAAVPLRSYPGVPAFRRTRNAGFATLEAQPTAAAARTSGSGAIRRRSTSVMNAAPNGASSTRERRWSQSTCSRRDRAIPLTLRIRASTDAAGKGQTSHGVSLGIVLHRGAPAPSSPQPIHVRRGTTLRSRLRL